MTNLGKERGMDSMSMTFNTVNQIKKGTMLYVQNTPVESVSLVVKGRVLVYNAGTKIVCGPGSFLGISDLVEGNYAASYYAVEDVQIFPIVAKNIDDVEELLENRTDYRSTIVTALSRQITELYRGYTVMEKGAMALKNFIESTYENYISSGKKYSISVTRMSEIESLPEMETYENIADIKYYVACASLPVEVQKAYYAHSSEIALHHMEEQITIISNLQEYGEKIALYTQSLFGYLFGADPSLYQSVAQMALDMKKQKADLQSILRCLSEAKNIISEVEKRMQTNTGRKLVYDKEKLEQINALLDGLENTDAEHDDTVSAATAVRYAGVDTETIERELNGSLGKLLAYSQLSEEVCNKFQQSVLEFMNLQDKYSTEDDARKLRKNLANGFYELYEAIFMRARNEENPERLVQLFLNYGFVDERLLSKEQLIQLYCLEDQKEKEGPCRVYTGPQWLEAVLTGKKEPSKSEFDMDYYDNLRDMKKNGQITEKQMVEAKTDQLQKFRYELKNMFRYNSRVVSGQISVFVPILYQEAFVGHLDTSLLTTNKVNSLMEKITSVDYSLFYRESMQNDPARHIEKEYIQVEIFPDIILLPVYGSNGAMWQEIEGRKRVSHGRFLLPIFAENDMEDILIRLCGRFRWELCRTIQGTTWNDIKYKSLTSEYVDYIQFYKKNRALSQERKDKLKLQIQKGRGNTREVFVLDYVLWVKNESSGSMRLNKVARELLAMYCPFRKEIRDRLESQPLFQEAMARFNRECQKKVKELDLRYRTMEKKGVVLSEEMQDTLAYYRDL